jgi:hypothetical protein
VTALGSNTAGSISQTILNRPNPDKARLDTRSNAWQFLERARGKIPLALLLPELKPTPAKLMHFCSGLLMYFCSGVDTQMITEWLRAGSAGILSYQVAVASLVILSLWLVETLGECPYQISG